MAKYRNEEQISDCLKMIWGQEEGECDYKVAT